MGRTPVFLAQREVEFGAQRVQEQVHLVHHGAGPCVITASLYDVRKPSYRMNTGGGFPSTANPTSLPVLGSAGKNRSQRRVTSCHDSVSPPPRVDLVRHMCRGGEVITPVRHMCRILASPSDVASVLLSSASLAFCRAVCTSGPESRSRPSYY